MVLQVDLSSSHFPELAAAMGEGKGRDGLDRSMAIPSEHDYHENSGKLDVKAKVQRRREQSHHGQVK